MPMGMPIPVMMPVPVPVMPIPVPVFPVHHRRPSHEDQDMEMDGEDEDRHRARAYPPAGLRMHEREGRAQSGRQHQTYRRRARDGGIEIHYPDGTVERAADADPTIEMTDDEEDTHMTSVADRGSSLVVYGSGMEEQDVVMRQNTPEVEDPVEVSITKASPLPALPNHTSPTAKQASRNPVVGTSRTQTHIADGGVGESRREAGSASEGGKERGAVEGNARAVNSGDQQAGLRSTQASELDQMSSKPEGELRLASKEGVRIGHDTDTTATSVKPPAETMTTNPPKKTPPKPLILEPTPSTPISTATPPRSHRNAVTRPEHSDMVAATVPNTASVPVMQSPGRLSIPLTAGQPKTDRSLIDKSPLNSFRADMETLSAPQSASLSAIMSLASPSPQSPNPTQVLDRLLQVTGLTAKQFMAKVEKGEFNGVAGINAACLTGPPTSAKETKKSAREEE